MSALKKMAAAALLALGFATVAEAAPVLDSGWFSDDVENANNPSIASPYEFTLVAPAMFRITDAFVVGDTYTVYNFGSLILTTSFQGFAAGFGDNPSADFGWTSDQYGSAEIMLAAGTYSLDVFGDGAGGFPAGFYTRLDSVASIPVPAALPLLLSGVAGLLVVARRRKA